MHAVTTTENELRPVAADAWRGIELCRQGQWQEGFYLLCLTADGQEVNDLPSEFFAYLGYGLARFQDELEEGVRMCRRAVELDSYNTNSHYLLAQTCLLAGDRRSAVEAIERGLRVDSTSERLRNLKSAIGERRRPVLSFLPRRHLLNRTLGRWRHQFFGAHKSEHFPEP